jgi:LysR family glycine cleavage system transcriptional activator
MPSQNSEKLNPMAIQLPSLSLLRAFEATARHLSFTRAAVELHLTQTAISHRIKELETLLGVLLFNRQKNAITLTERGRTYLEGIRPALAQIAVATNNSSKHHENNLTITCQIAFAIECLMPALGDFRERHPEIELRINPTFVTYENNPQEFDIAIWHGMNDWPKWDAQQILLEESFPVCAPQLLAGNFPLRTPADLAHHTIVRTVSPLIADEWSAWLQLAELPHLSFQHEISCSSLFLSTSAALNGLGIGMGRTSLSMQAIAAGRLVEPFRIRLPSESSYYVLNQPEKSDLAKVKMFKAWVMDYFGGTWPRASLLAKAAIEVSVQKPISAQQGHQD